MSAPVAQSIGRAPRAPQNPGEGLPRARQNGVNALTARGRAAALAIRLQDAVRRLDRADREYLAPYVSDVLVDLCTDIQPSR